MKRDEVMSFPGAEEFVKVPGFPPYVEIPGQWIHAHFSEDDEVTEVEAVGDADAVLNGVSLLRQPLDEMLSALRSFGIDLVEDANGADAPAQGFGVYAPVDDVEAVIVYPPRKRIAGTGCG